MSSWEDKVIQKCSVLIYTVENPDPQVSGGLIIQPPRIKGGGGGVVLKNDFSQPYRPWFGLKIRWGPRPPEPITLSTTVNMRQ